MNILCVFGEHAYGDPSRGEGYEHANFLPALRRLGHRVTVFESFSREPYADFSELNRALLRRVEEFAPDVVFCVLMQYEVWVETLRLIRKAGPMLVNWSTDDSWKYPMFSKLIGKEFDLFITTAPSMIPRYLADGIDAVYPSQWAADAASAVSPISAAACRYPVSFVGAAYGNRRVMVDVLRGAGIDVACFGHGWPQGPVEAKHIAEIMTSSQISLNFSVGSRRGPEGKNRQIKARVFEVPGYGGCLLTESAPGLEDYFAPGEEIVVFEDRQELVEQVKSLLAHPERRDKIARRGFERVQRDHTYDRRFRDMLEALGKRVERRARCPVDWMEFAAAADRHCLSAPLRISRSALVFLASLLWGWRRGPRAARRLTFDLCCRLGGIWTYTAAGWPGRMFYKES